MFMAMRFVSDIVFGGRGFSNMKIHLLNAKNKSLPQHPVSLIIVMEANFTIFNTALVFVERQIYQHSNNS